MTPCQISGRISPRLIREPTVTKPENSASDAALPSDASPKKAASAAETVPNRPVEAGAAAASATASSGSVTVADSLLVGTPSDPSLQPAKRKAMTETSPSSVPPTTQPSAAKPADPVKTEPAKIIETKVVEVRKAGFFPMLLGGVVAAGLGAGGAYYAIPHLPAAWQPVAPVDAQAQIDAARAAAVEAARTEIAGARSQLLSDANAAAVTTAREAAQKLLDEQPVRPDAGAGDLGATVADMQAALAAQADRVAALGTALDALRMPEPVTGAQASSTAGLQSGGTVDAQALQAVQSLVAQLRAEVDAQGARITELAARPAGDPDATAQISALAAQAAEMQSRIAAAAEEAQSRIAAAQAEAESVRAETATIGRRAQIAAAAAGLQAALESGGNLAGGLADLRAAGVEPPAALNGEVVSLTYLQRDFDDAARSGLRASLKAQSQGGGAMGAIGNFLRVQTGARSVEPREGDDPDAVLSRAGAAVRLGNIAAALTAIASLPPEGQEAMASWTAQAKQWSEARAALADLAATAN